MLHTGGILVVSKELFWESQIKWGERLLLLSSNPEGWFYYYFLNPAVGSRE